jgi:hypothetical protein
MNTRLLAPLIQEYVKNGRIADADMDFLRQAAQQVEVSNDTLRALVAIEQERQQPTAPEPAALVYNLVNTLAVQGKVNVAHYDLLKELGAGIRTSAAAVQALINAYHARQGVGVYSKIRTLSALARGLFRGQGYPQGTVEFLMQRAAELKIAPPLATALVQAELLALQPGALSAVVVFDGLLQKAHAAAEWKTPEKEFYIEKGAELKIPHDVVLALLELQEHPPSAGNLFGGEAITPLLQAYARNAITSEAELNLLMEKAKVHRMDASVALSLLQLEQALHEDKPAEAERLLNTVMQELKKGKANLSVTESTFATKKMMEVAAAQKQAQLRAQLKAARPIEQRPAATPTPTPAMEKQAPLRPASPNYVRTNDQRNLEEVFLYTLPDAYPVVRKARLLHAPGGTNWYVQLGSGTVSGNEGLIILNGAAHDVKDVSDVTLSDDGAHMAYVLRKADKQHVVLDGKPSDPYDYAGGLSFSPDGDSFACIVKNIRSYYVLQNGSLGRPYPGIRDLVFNPANNRLAYAVVDDKKWHVLYNGVLDPAYGASGGLKFSPDGSVFVYWAKGGTKAFVVMNSMVGPGFEGIGEIVFSPNSKQLAYFVNLQGGKAAVFWGGRTGQVFDRIRKLQFSPDASQLLYLGTKDGREYLVTNHTPGTAYDEIDSPLFSQSGRTVAYVATQNKERKVVLNGSVGNSYVEVSKLTFRPGSEQLAYKAHRDKQWMVVLDGEESEGFTDIDDLAFSPHGDSLGFIGKQRNQWTGVVINGQRKAEAANPKHLVFDEDGNRYAYMIYKKEGWTLHINDRPAHAKPYTDLLQPPKYDAERKAFYFFAKQGNNLVLVFVS